MKEERCEFGCLPQALLAMIAVGGGITNCIIAAQHHAVEKRLSAIEARLSPEKVEAPK